MSYHTRHPACCPCASAGAGCAAELLYSPAWFPPAYFTLLDTQLRLAAQHLTGGLQEPQQQQQPAGQQHNSYRQLAGRLVEQLKHNT